MKTMNKNQSSDTAITKERSTKKQFSKAHTRHTLIQQRNELSEAQLNKAAKALRNQALLNQKLRETLLSAKHILSYLAFNGEISPHYLTNNLLAKIYLPKIIDYQNKLMQFFPADQHLRKNRYGISEPIGTDNPSELELFDIILLPLVAFDQQGNRLGMGGGFYDKAISNKTIKPLLIGLAHGFQQQESIKPEVWDVPLDVILTDQEIFDPANVLSC